jgi:hypothetical protein
LYEKQEYDAFILRWNCRTADLTTTTITTNKHSNTHRWSKKKRKKEYALKTKYVCTHIHTKCLHHPLTALALFSVFFLFFFFLRIHIRAHDLH